MADATATTSMEDALTAANTCEPQARSLALHSPIEHTAASHSNFDYISSMTLVEDNDAGETASVRSIIDEGHWEKDDASINTAVRSSIYAGRWENCRKYHAFRPEIDYGNPEDEREQDRLHLQHRLCYITFNKEYYTAPVGENIQRIVDAGTGTGEWAIKMGDKFPLAEVIGLDLSPIQPYEVPSNVRFFVDNIEDEWLDENVDFAFIRMLDGSINDWPKLIGQSHRSLRPGGWLEIQGFEWILRGCAKQGSYIAKWAEYIKCAMRKAKRPAGSGAEHERQMLDAGFRISAVFSVLLVFFVHLIPLILALITALVSILVSKMPYDQAAWESATCFNALVLPIVFMRWYALDDPNLAASQQRNLSWMALSISLILSAMLALSNAIRPAQGMRLYSIPFPSLLLALGAYGLVVWDVFTTKPFKCHDSRLKAAGAPAFIIAVLFGCNTGFFAGAPLHAHRPHRIIVWVLSVLATVVVEAHSLIQGLRIAAISTPRRNTEGAYSHADSLRDASTSITSDEEERQDITSMSPTTVFDTK